MYSLDRVPYISIKWTSLGFHSIKWINYPFSVDQVNQLTISCRSFDNINIWSIEIMSKYRLSIEITTHSIMWNLADSIKWNISVNYIYYFFYITLITSLILLIRFDYLFTRIQGLIILSKGTGVWWFSWLEFLLFHLFQINTYKKM